MNIMRNKDRRWIPVVVALAVTLSPMRSAFAAAAEGPGFVDSLKFGGDIRARHDTLMQPGGSTDRNRERFRVRYGVEAVIQDFTVYFRMASGTGSQVSANQTESGGFSQKALWIDQASRLCLI